MVKEKFKRIEHLTIEKAPVCETAEVGSLYQVVPNGFLRPKTEVGSGATAPVATLLPLPFIGQTAVGPDVGHGQRT